MKKIILTLLLVLFMATTVRAENLKPMKLTVYTPQSCPGDTTASGHKVREGIVASTKDHLGDAVLVYTREGEFVGIYECLDTGKGKIQPDGRGAIECGYVLDMWFPDMNAAAPVLEKTQGNILVQYIERPKG